MKMEHTPMNNITNNTVVAGQQQEKITDSTSELLSYSNELSDIVSGIARGDVHINEDKFAENISTLFRDVRTQYDVIRAEQQALEMATDTLEADSNRYNGSMPGSDVNTVDNPAKSQLIQRLDKLSETQSLLKKRIKSFHLKESELINLINESNRRAGAIRVNNEIPQTVTDIIGDRAENNLVHDSVDMDSLKNNTLVGYKSNPITHVPPGSMLVQDVRDTMHTNIVSDNLPHVATTELQGVPSLVKKEIKPINPIMPALNISDQINDVKTNNLSIHDELPKTTVVGNEIPVVKNGVLGSVANNNIINAGAENANFHVADVLGEQEKQIPINDGLKSAIQTVNTSNSMRVNIPQVGLSTAVAQTQLADSLVSSSIKPTITPDTAQKNTSQAGLNTINTQNQPISNIVTNESVPSSSYIKSNYVLVVKDGQGIPDLIKQTVGVVLGMNTQQEQTEISTAVLEFLLQQRKLGIVPENLINSLTQTRTGSEFDGNVIIKYISEHANTFSGFVIAHMHQSLIAKMGNTEQGITTYIKQRIV